MIWNILCPKCGATLDASTDMLGGLVECGSCANIFQSPKEALPAPDPRFDRRMNEEWEEARDDTDNEAAHRRGLGRATASLVLGILALSVGTVLMFCFMPFVQTILGVLAVLLGFFGLKTEGRKMAIAGMVMGALASIMSLLAGIMLGTLFYSLNNAKKAAPSAAVFQTVSTKSKPATRW
jgi:hypothetical protein